MVNKITFDEIKNQSKIDLHIDKDDLAGASTNAPILHHKYLMELFVAKDQLIKLEQQYKDLYKKKWIHYSGKGTPEDYRLNPFDLKILKSDMNIFFSADKELAELDYKIQYLKLKVDFISRVVDEINRRTFVISNAIKFLRFTNGENN